MNRRPIFQAVKQLRGGADFLAHEVRILDAGIDEALATLSADPAPATALPVMPAPAAQMTKWQAMIDLALLRIAFPANTTDGLKQWVEPTRAACVRWGIDTAREVASFLANINVESAGLTRMSESLNYSTEALIEKFGRHRISIADAQRFGRSAGRAANEEQLANILYGGAFGRENLGNMEPGDGWRFRGYGPKQLTGRANQTAFANAMGISVDEVGQYLRTPEGGMMGAGWFWYSHGLDAKAATAGLRDDRKAINGGLFGLAQVEATFDDVLEELLRRERAPRTS